MAITNGYCTLAEVKSRLDITDTDNDTELESVIEAVSRYIDQYMAKKRGNTKFYASTETRYFTAYWSDKLAVDDLLSITTLKSDESGNGTYDTTWATTDYNTWPYNITTPPEPIEQLELAFNGDEAFPAGVPRGVEIVGSWGYNTGASTDCPDVIREACILASMRLWKRRDAIFGVAGTTALGVQTVRAMFGDDPAVVTLLESIPNRTW